VRASWAVAALTGAAVVAVAAGAAYAKPGPKPPRDNPPPAYTFQISGSVDGLYPGATRTMALTLSNTPNAGRLVVTSVKVESVSVDKGGCHSDVVSSDGWSGKKSIPKNGTATISVDVSMDTDAPTDCQGATFTLEYTGTGER